MVSLEELKKISVLDNLSRPMLQKLQPLAQLSIFGEHHVIFETGQDADYFYMLLKGKLILEVEATETIMISLESIKAGQSFGWSALFPGSKYRALALCVEPCETMAVRGSDFLELCERDHELGYRFMNRVADILGRRVVRRSEQFLKVMSRHPDLQKLMGLS